MNNTEYAKHQEMQRRENKLAEILQNLFFRVHAVETDQAFSYRFYMLAGENQGRIYRVKGGLAPQGCGGVTAPKEGRFVAAAINPTDQRLTLAFGEHPADGSESQYTGALAYDEREYDKIPSHLIQYLANGTAPEADGEYDVNNAA